LLININLYSLEITPYKDNYIGLNIKSKNYYSYRYNIEYDNKEISYQMSGKLKLLSNNLKYNQLYLGFTNTSYWQIFAGGSPFREHNYEPELFYKHNIYNKYFNRNIYLTIGIFGHRSNGETNESLSNQTLLSQNENNVDYINRFKTRSINYNFFEYKINDFFINNLTFTNKFYYYYLTNIEQNKDYPSFVGDTFVKLNYKINKFNFEYKTSFNFFNKIEDTKSYKNSLFLTNQFKISYSIIKNKNDGIDNLFFNYNKTKYNTNSNNYNYNFGNKYINNKINNLQENNNKLTKKENSNNISIFLKFSSSYNDSLIDYNRLIYKAQIGIQLF
jgi:outer membrane phospholipase A